MLEFVDIFFFNVDIYFNKHLKKQNMVFFSLVFYYYSGLSVMSSTLVSTPLSSTRRLQ